MTTLTPTPCPNCDQVLDVENLHCPESPTCPWVICIHCGVTANPMSGRFMERGR